MSVTSIRLQDELEQPLNDLVKKQQRSKNWLINQAIKEYLENCNVQDERWLQTIPALASVKNGKNVPETEVNEWLESWGKDGEKSAPIR